MITLFATPRPAQGKFAIIQRNAIASWKALSDPVEVILIGDAQGTAELADEFDCRHQPEVECNEHGTPLVSSIFSVARGLATYDTLAYVNADIILMDDFVEAVRRIRRRPFLLVGCSWGLKVEERLDFSHHAWRATLAAAVPGQANRRSGMDYFVFGDGTWADIPPFAVGRGWWDQWLIYGALSNGVPTIDASDSTLVIHQDHDWSAVPGGHQWIWDGPEIKRNRELAGPLAITYSIHDATWRLTERHLLPRFTRRRLSRLAERLGTRYPALRPVSRLVTPVLHPRSLLRD